MRVSEGLGCPLYADETSKVCSVTCLHWSVLEHERCCGPHQRYFVGSPFHLGEASVSERSHPIFDVSVDVLDALAPTPLSGQFGKGLGMGKADHGPHAEGQ